MVQQGQTGQYASFATPREYRVTPELGDCIFDQKSVTTITKSSIGFLEALANRQADGLAETTITSSNSQADEVTSNVQSGNTQTVDKNKQSNWQQTDEKNKQMGTEFSASGEFGYKAGGLGGYEGKVGFGAKFSESSGEATTVGNGLLTSELVSNTGTSFRGDGTSKSYNQATTSSTVVSSMLGNSAEAKSSYSAAASGNTQSVTTIIKRSYYKASIAPGAITTDSFTDEFKKDAQGLVDYLKSSAVAQKTKAPSGAQTTATQAPTSFFSLSTAQDFMLTISFIDKWGNFGKTVLVSY